MTRTLQINPFLPAARMSVRVATPTDAEAVSEISALAITLLRKTYRPTQAALVSQSTCPPPYTRLVILLHDRVVGTVRYTLEADRIHLIGLFVHPQFQQQGIARQLIQALTEIGQQRNVRCLSLHTVKETGNADIFEKLGFATIREQADQQSESDLYAQLTDVYMEKGVA